MNLTGLRTHQQVKRARREFNSKHPRLKTREDFEQEGRIQMLVFALFCALIVVPMVLLFADALTGMTYGYDAIAAVLEAVVK